MAAVVTLVAVRLGYLGDPGAGPAAPQAWLPILIATAAWCVLVLGGSTRPSMGWLSAILALATVTLDLAGLLRGARATVDATTWSWLLVLLGLVAVATVTAAAAYATDPARRLGWWVLPVAVGGVAVVAVAAIAAIGTAQEPVDATASPLGSGTLITRGFLIATVGLVVFGVLGDLRPAAQRARRRLAVERPSATTVGGRIEAAIAWTRLFADELSPGRTRAGRAATAERSRLARDLHAEVVPGLRRALAQASGDVPVGELESTLRGVLGTVEAIGNDEHAIQLELGGLVPAIEWLAERAEAASTVRITIDVADPGRHPGRRRPRSPRRRTGSPGSPSTTSFATRRARRSRSAFGRTRPSWTWRSRTTGPAWIRWPSRRLVVPATAAWPIWRPRPPRVAEHSGIESVRAGGHGTRVRFDWPAS